MSGAATRAGPAAAFLAERRGAGGGLLVVAIAGLLAGLLGWAAWASVEEVVRAPGRVAPVGQVRLVSHPQGGKVAELLVRDGERVEAGAPLLRLDPAVIQAERAELEARLQQVAASGARLAAEAEGRPLALDPTLAAARPDLATTQDGLLRARAAARASREAALMQAVDGRRGELARARAELARVTTGEGLLEQQLGSIRELASRGLYPRLRLAAAEKQLADARGERSKALAALATAEAELAEAEARLVQAQEDWRRDVLAELAEARAEVERLKERLAAALARLDAVEIRAPAAGIVTDLSVTGPGQSVPAAATLLRLVPVGERLTVEARVRNADIGRVRPGMAATVKVLAFDYTRFGTLAGTVTRVAPDAAPDPAGDEPRYLVAVTTDGEALGGEHAIVPGMLVDVELAVGERTILSYLTERLWKIRDGAFKDG